MWVNKKDFNALVESNAAIRQSSIEIAKAFNNLKLAFEQREQELKTQANFYKSRWLTIVCPNCNHDFNFHTMQRLDE
jgi:hypothetical protein